MPLILSACGLPVIAFDSGNLRTLMSAHRCGELIDSVDQVPEAARKILDRYDQYRLDAYRAFEEFYNCDRNFATLLPHLKNAFG